MGSEREASRLIGGRPSTCPGAGAAEAEATARWHCGASKVDRMPSHIGGGGGRRPLLFQVCLSGLSFSYLVGAVSLQPERERERKKELGSSGWYRYLGEIRILLGKSPVVIGSQGR